MKIDSETIDFINIDVADSDCGLADTCTRRKQ